MNELVAICCPSKRLEFMSKYFFILLTVLTSFTTFRDEPIDRIGVKGPLTFDKTIFKLSWTDKPSTTYYVQEYLPEGENVDHFNQMLSVFLLIGDIKIEDAVQQKVQELETRKKTDGTCNYMVNQNPDTKEYMVDFIVGQANGDLMEIQEFNIYRYKQVELSNGRKGILVYVYSKRAYGNDITPFLKHLPKNRIAYLKIMISAEMPTVSMDIK